MCNWTKGSRLEGLLHYVVRVCSCVDYCCSPQCNKHTILRVSRESKLWRPRIASDAEDDEKKKRGRWMKSHRERMKHNWKVWANKTACTQSSEIKRLRRKGLLVCVFVWLALKTRKRSSSLGQYNCQSLKICSLSDSLHSSRDASFSFFAAFIISFFFFSFFSLIVQRSWSLALSGQPINLTRVEKRTV